jgi:hypothetical protein
MKKLMLWMMAAILICGANVFTACGNVDDPASGGEEPVIDNLAEKVIGKWIVYEKEGEPALTNQKVVIDFKSSTLVTVSLSSMNIWHNNDAFDYKIEGNVISCEKQMDEHTYSNIVVKVNAIDENKMYEDFSNTISIDGVETIKLKSRETLIRVNEDYSEAIIGLWECTELTGIETFNNANARLEFFNDGTYQYWRKNDAGEWETVTTREFQNYFVAGTLLATRWKNVDENELREWWEIDSIDGDQMVWTALRQKNDGTTVQQVMKWVKK